MPMSSMYKARKVVIVGAGAVGSTFAYALAQKGFADEIALMDVHQDYVEGQVLDLATACHSTRRCRSGSAGRKTMPMPT